MIKQKKEAIDKSNELSLAASELRYRRLFEASRDGNLILDYDTGKVIDVNPFLTELLGFPRKWFVGKQLWELGAFRDIAQSKANFLKLKKNRSVHYDNLPMETADGRTISVEFYTNVFGVGDKKVIQCNIRDITERKQKEETFEKSKHLLDEAGRLAMVGGWELDLVKNKMIWTDAVYRIHEVGRNFKPTVETGINFYTPDSKPIITDAVKRAIEKGRPFDVQLQLITAKKNRIWVRSVGEAIKENGRVVKIRGVFQDITERRKTEVSLSEARQHYQDLFENASIGLLRSTPGPEGAFIDVNPAMVRMFEAKSREQLMALHPSTIYWDKSQRKIISDAIMAKGFAKEEIKYKTLKGNLIWCHIYSVKKIDANGKVYFDSTIEDFTERKRKEEEASRMVTVVRDSNDAITIQDLKGNIIAWNRGAERMFGYSEKDALKMKIWQLAPSYKAKEQRDFNRRIFAGEKVTSFETQRMTKDGRTLDIWLTVTKLVDNAGKVIGIAATDRDITDRKRTEEVKDQFLNTTSHELKSPLIPIKSQCQLLLDGDYGVLNKDQREAVEMINKNEDHLEKLVTDVLDISKARTNKLKFNFEKADLGTLVRDSVANIKIVAKKDGIALSLKIAPALPRLLVDTKRITQVMGNLLVNALKNTPGKGTVAVEVIKTKDGVQVSIHDTGIGMDKLTLEKIFTPFFQADAGLNRKYGGTGLGLSICKEFVESHGGTIRGLSEGLKKGSTFVFTLPLKFKPRIET